MKFSQCDKILSLLRDRRGVWVPITELHTASGSYVIHSRVSDLRKRGHSISQRNEWLHGQCHSFYKLNQPDSPEAQLLDTSR
jgi:hypothetical protein